MNAKKRISAHDRSKQSYPEVFTQQQYVVLEKTATQLSSPNNFSVCLLLQLEFIELSLAMLSVSQGRSKMIIKRNPSNTAHGRLFQMIVQSYRTNRIFVVEISSTQLSSHLASNAPVATIYKQKIEISYGQPMDSDPHPLREDLEYSCHVSVAIQRNGDLLRYPHNCSFSKKNNI